MKAITRRGKNHGGNEVLCTIGGNTCGNPSPVIIGLRAIGFLLPQWNLGKDMNRNNRQKSKDTRRYLVKTENDGNRLE